MTLVWWIFFLFFMFSCVTVFNVSFLDGIQLDLSKESILESLYLDNYIWYCITRFLCVSFFSFPWFSFFDLQSWTVKKAELQGIDAFELWCWRRLLRVPWTARRSNQSILKDISPGCSLEGRMLKLKLQNFGHLMQRVDLLEKTLMLGGIGAEGEGDDRGWDGWMASPTWWTWVWVNSGSWWWTGRPGVPHVIHGVQRVRHNWETELNWWVISIFYFLGFFNITCYSLLILTFYPSRLAVESLLHKWSVKVSS